MLNYTWFYSKCHIMNVFYNYSNYTKMFNIPCLEVTV